MGSDPKPVSNIQKGTHRKEEKDKWWLSQRVPKISHFVLEHLTYFKIN